MLTIANHVSIAESEIDLSAIRAQGSGGQHVNKVSSAIHLRFDIEQSSLPDDYKERLLALKDQRITKDGIIVIKSQQFRTQEKNKTAALERLSLLIKSIAQKPKVRRATKPSRNSSKKRMDKKTKHSQKKELRGRVNY